MLSLLVLFGCDLDCSVISRKTDLGPLPESAISYMPYADGEQVKFLQPDDSVVTLKVSRENTRKYQYYEDECSRLTLIYELNLTQLATPDSVLDVWAWVTNLAQIDVYDVRVGVSHFQLPVSQEYRAMADLIKNCTINGIAYQNVYRIPRDTVLMTEKSVTLADTLFFNEDHGFLEFIMEDGTRYMREE